jgi:hypothetical protein
MSRSNLEYGAIIEADDDNDGDLVSPHAMEATANSSQGQTDLEFHGKYHSLRTAELTPFQISRPKKT